MTTATQTTPTPTRRRIQDACHHGETLAEVVRMAMDAGLDDATATRLAIALSHGDHPSTLPYLDADLVRRVVERLGL